MSLPGIVCAISIRPTLGLDLRIDVPVERGDPLAIDGHVSLLHAHDFHGGRGAGGGASDRLHAHRITMTKQPQCLRSMPRTKVRTRRTMDVLGWSPVMGPTLYRRDAVVDWTNGVRRDWRTRACALITKRVAEAAPD